MWAIGQISWMQRYGELHLPDKKDTAIGGVGQFSLFEYKLGSNLWRIGHANELSYSDMGDWPDEKDTAM